MTLAVRQSKMVIMCIKDRSTLLKCLVFLVSVLIMILVALAIILVNRKNDTHTCKSEHCIRLSAEVIRYSDKNINPCEDFHSFTCGKFIKNRKEFPPPPPDEEIKTMISEMVQPNDSKPFIMQKTFYLSCSNLAAIEIDNDETLLDYFFSLGDWPVLRGAQWDGTFFDWTDVAKKSRKMGLKFDWFLDFSIYEDFNDTGLNILKIDIPPLTSLKEHEILPRQQMFTRIAIDLGAPEKLVHYETGTTVDFEVKLKRLAEKHRNNKTHLNPFSLPKVTINEVQVLWPNIQWLDLINNITGGKMIGSDYIIFDEVLDYVKDLNTLIYGTPKRIVADYMMWTILEELSQYLSGPIRQKFEEYFEKYNQKPAELNRQKFCINESRKQFPLIAESEYIRRHVTGEKKNAVKEITSTIRNRFLHILRGATSIRRDVKQKAIYKLENLKFSVGGPPQVFDEFGFAEELGLYGFVFKTSSNVIDMLTQRRLRFYDNYFSIVNRPVTHRTERFYEKVVNITRFTVINGNTLIIPAAVLRDSFYNPKLPNYFNYATLGRILIHEIFEHIFERNNRTIIDEENRNYNSVWTSDIFDTAVKCLIKETSFIHSPELRSPKTIRELLADFVAPDVAYESYKDWALMYPQESKLPALEFTPGQLFWIHTSKLSCNKIYSKHDRDYSRFKIIGPLRNSRNFARDYNCTESSRMYLRKPCRIF